MSGRRLPIAVLPVLLLAAALGPCSNSPKGALAMEVNGGHHVGMRKLLQEEEEAATEGASDKTNAQMKLDAKLVKAASTNAPIKKIQKYLNKGADPNAHMFNRTSLHFAAFYNNPELAQVLIDAEADVDAMDNDGVTPLHSAAVFNADEVVRVLLEGGADVNAVDKGGDTALHMAALRGFVEMAELLVGEGADTTIKNNKKKTPKQVICRGTIPSIRACAKGSDQDLSLKELLG